MVTVKDPGAAYRPGDTRPSWLARLLADRQPLVMGVLNLTPDSFSDGGQFLDPAKAIAHARRMIAEGADIIDGGAESTRPYGGAVRVGAAEELRRLAPVIAPLVGLGVPVSVDTMKSEVAQWACDQGAGMINDVWGLQRDKGMAAIMSRNGLPVVVMHNRDAVDPALDIMADIEAFFAQSWASPGQAGIAGNRRGSAPESAFARPRRQTS